MRGVPRKPAKYDVILETERQNLKRLIRTESITKNSRHGIRTASRLEIEYILDPVETEGSVGVSSFRKTKVLSRCEVHRPRALVYSSTPYDNGSRDLPSAELHLTALINWNGKNVDDKKGNKEIG